MTFERYEKIPLPETRTAFDCCISLPTDCESCPLREFPELTNKAIVRMDKCRGTLKANVRYWLERAENKILAEAEEGTGK